MRGKRKRRRTQEIQGGNGAGRNLQEGAEGANGPSVMKALLLKGDVNGIVAVLLSEPAKVKLVARLIDPEKNKDKKMKSEIVWVTGITALDEAAKNNIYIKPAKRALEGIHRADKSGTAGSKAFGTLLNHKDHFRG